MVRRDIVKMLMVAGMSAAAAGTLANPGRLGPRENVLQCAYGRR